MGRYDRYDSRTDFWKDIVIVTHHPRYDGMTMTEALGDLYERRDDPRGRPNYDD